MFSGPQQTPPMSHKPIFFNQQQMEHPVTVVGPSEHYGMHHPHQSFVNNNGNNTNINSYSNSHDNATENLSAKPNQMLQNEETKVCVIVDSRTPVIFKIPQSPERITLADLKRALPAIDQPNYKYFFKSNDSEFGIVKEEIQDDDNRLPTYRNRVVAWIVTPARIGDEFAAASSKTNKSEIDTCNLTYSNTSYDDGSSSLRTTDIDSNTTTSYFTETEDDEDDDGSVSCSNYSETTCDTFISQRRNRLYKNNDGKSPIHHGSNHHHYSDHHNQQHQHLAASNSSPYRYNNSSSQIYRTRKDQLDNLSPPSSSQTSSSSASQSNATAVHCLTVHLVLTNENFLGLYIYTYAVDGRDEGIFVDEVAENSAVALDGRIEPGDKLIQVNEINLEELSNKEAMRILKDSVIKRGPLKLVVAKYVETNKNEIADGLVNPKEAIYPIDTAAWVAHAQAITIPNIGKDHANSATSSPSFGSNAHDTDFIRPASAGMHRSTTGLRLNRNTTDIKEIILHMNMPEVGIDIKDREWLKIHIPKAFLGSELITWLERNVYGFDSNREAKKFASRMLKEGYIRDPISKKSFSSKSYYTFVI